MKSNKCPFPPAVFQHKHITFLILFMCTHFYLELDQYSFASLDLQYVRINNGIDIENLLTLCNWMDLKTNVIFIKSIKFALVH